MMKTMVTGQTGAPQHETPNGDLLFMTLTTTSLSGSGQFDNEDLWELIPHSQKPKSVGTRRL